MSAVDLSPSLAFVVNSSVTQARVLLEEGRKRESAQLYRRCAHLLRREASMSLTPQGKKRRLERAKALEQLAERLTSEEALPEASHFSSPSEHRDFILSLIHRSPVDWSQLAGLEEVRDEILRAYGLSLAQKPPRVRLEGFRKILLYGPPGTGKTLLAAATSHGLDATFFNVKVSNLLSKYFGESSQLVSALYQQAREKAPSVVFLDEFEALGARRSLEQMGVERRLLATLLSELDGMANKGEAPIVLTMAATNAPWLLDEALLSRFEKRFSIPLPQEGAREQMFRIFLIKRGIEVKTPLKDLAKKTEGYTGREIERLCQEALQRMLRQMNPKLSEVSKQGMDAIRSYQVRLRPLEEADFTEALEKVKPETTQEQLKQFHLFEKG